MTAPADIPIRSPVVGFIVAIEGLLLLQEPPVVVSAKVMLSPTHSVEGPNMGPT